MRLHWIVACLLGEALGIAAVGTTYAAVDRGLLSPVSGWILGAGAWEGLCLGGAQALVLRKIGTRPLHWIALTVVGAVVGYALSLTGGAGESASAGTEPPSAWLLLVLGAGLGLVMGTLMGAIQWVAVRDKIAFWAWVIANAIGWAPAMAIIMFTASMVERTWPLYSITIVGAGAGALAGLSVGAVTGVVVQRTAARQ